LGTVFGVLVIPGLYYLFGKIADGRKLLQDEVDGPLSEVFEHNATGPDEQTPRVAEPAAPPAPTPPMGEVEGFLPEAEEIPPDAQPRPPSNGTAT
jgi:HAE1 family hydrophobic/amphiphilic exporter-1